MSQIGKTMQPNNNKCHYLKLSLPYPDYSDNGLERLEPKTDEELDQVDYRARPANDSRPPKSTQR